MTDPIEQLSVVVELAKLYRRLDCLLNGVRKIDESAEQTLIRILKERQAVVNLLHKNDVQHNYDDYNYSHFYVEHIKGFIKKAGGKDAAK